MLFFALVNQQSYSSIAGDVNRGTRHIQDTVDTCDKSRAFQRRPRLVRIMVNMMKPAPGTPAVPIEAKVPVTIMVMYWEAVRSMPYS